MQKIEDSNLGSLKPVGPYSMGIFSSGLLFISGQIGLNSETGVMVTGGVQQEANQVLKNIDTILGSVQLSAKNVVMVSIFLVDMADFKLVNSIYSQWVDVVIPPARQTVAVKELPLGAKIEISLIAEAKKSYEQNID